MSRPVSSCNSMREREFWGKSAGRAPSRWHVLTAIAAQPAGFLQAAPDERPILTEEIPQASTASTTLSGCSGSHARKFVMKATVRGLLIGCWLALGWLPSAARGVDYMPWCGDFRMACGLAA